MKDRAIAFDFDGTLVYSGLDKGVHVMYSGYAACAEGPYRRFLHPDDPGLDVERVLQALLDYPGAPRFQQLSAMANALIHGRPEAVEDPSDLDVPPDVLAAYPALKDRYNRIYNSINNAAAERHWKAIPEAQEAIRILAPDFDLFVATGVLQDVLEEDLARHDFDRSLLQGAWGADRNGGNDKGRLLQRIKARGYEAVLFVGDTNRDLEYALQAGVNFFRYRVPDDFRRLVDELKSGMPHEPDSWSWTEGDIEFFRSKTRRLVDALLADRPLSPAQITDSINEGRSVEDAWG